MKLRRIDRRRALWLWCGVSLAATLAALVWLIEGWDDPKGLLDSTVGCEWLEPSFCGPAKG
jgi:hypothetical protein